MINVILYDDEFRENLLPIVFTKPVGELRVGIKKISEKWTSLTDASVSFLTQDYLSEKYPTQYSEDHIYWNSRFSPTKEILRFVNKLSLNEGLKINETVLCFRTSENLSLKDIHANLDSFLYSHIEEETVEIKNLWDIFIENGKAIRLDIQNSEIANQKVSHFYDSTIYGEDLFVHPSAKARGCILNTDNGPIYLGENSEVMEGSVIRGPFALCKGGVVKLQTKIYGATTVGPFSKVGGEINNSVIQGYSNKGHDGFLGNSIIGEWCNLGADTNNSNLKNNYGNVKVWNYPEKGFVDSERQFLGLIMGDHSKCGINTMFNTGTTIGIASNIFGGGFPDKFIPSFSWGGASGWKSYDWGKFLEVARIVMERRDVELTETDKRILEHIHLYTSEFRNYNEKLLTI
jgi:UDP-N-acetylglucosamine diphosphorylase/glucosamine-1-phosphate N-acetyltransferase